MGGWGEEDGEGSGVEEGKERGRSEQVWWCGACCKAGEGGAVLVHLYEGKGQGKKAVVALLVGVVGGPKSGLPPPQAGLGYLIFFL